MAHYAREREIATRRREFIGSNSNCSLHRAATVVHFYNEYSSRL